MSESRVWFKAKAFGWGWGAASTWQGWLTYAAFILLTAVAALVFPPTSSPALFAMSFGVLTVVLIGICFLKGEKPKWRWGR